MGGLNSLLDKYNQPKKKAPNSPAGEQIEIATKITGKDWGQIAGLTRHLSVDQMFILNKESKGKAQFWWTLYKTKFSTNNMQDAMVKKLEEFPAFRERKQRGIYLTKWALRDTGLLEKQSKGVMMTMNELSTFAIRYASLERLWRDTLLKHSELRGNDYDEGPELENKKLKQLGYGNLAR